MDTRMNTNIPKTLILTPVEVAVVLAALADYKSIGYVFTSKYCGEGNKG